MSPASKAVGLLALMIVAGIATLAIVSPLPDKVIEPCEDTRSTQAAPGGVYEAELVVHTCAWGFGQAGESAELKVTRIGPGGWFMHLPLEYDSTSEDIGTNAPTIAWTGPSALVVRIDSRAVRGTLVSRHAGGLSISRIYGAP